MCKCNPSKQWVELRAAWRKAGGPFYQPASCSQKHDDHDPDFFDDDPDEDISTTGHERDDWTYSREASY
jgi:hypothetical protein